MATVSGYAAVFDTETTIAGLFRERIQRGAFAAALKRDDIRGAFNHSADHILGRTAAGTLKLAEDAKGLRYSIEINESDPGAVSVQAKIARGDVSGSSFWFGIENPDTDEEWTIDDRSKLPLRTLKRLKLIDVGPVSYPAYPTTTSTAARTGAEGVARRELARAQIAMAKAWEPPRWM